jgi:hypothetical protein
MNVPAIDAPAARKRRGWLPLLTVLFLISYGLMTMLIVEQGATIESQRALIRELFRDSTELAAMRKAQQEKTVAETQQTVQAPTAKTQTPVTQHSTVRTPSTQIPSTQAPLTQAPLTQTPLTQAPATTSPSSQAVQQHRTQTKGEKQKQQFQMPSKAPQDLVDDPRTLNVI